MDEDSEIIASNLEIFDQNDNKLFQDDDKTENNFVGIGEDPNLERNFITSSVKKIKKIDTEDELDAKGPPEVQYLCKVVQKLVLENYTPLKTSDFQDRESILNALNSLLLSISRDDSLLEWMENSSHFLGFAENFTDITNHPSSNYRATSSPKESLDSSLGILSNLSSFSSNEAILIDHSGAIDLNDSKPTYDYLGEIEDLQHKIKGLNEERTHLLQQMAQTEEINSNLFYENQDLQRNQQNLQGILEKMKEAEREYARLKLTVSNYEETNHTLQEKLTGHHRERLSLEARIRDLNDEITIVNQELDGLRNEFDELNEVLVQTRQELSCMKDANDILSHSLKEESEMLKENELKLSDLLESNNYLKNQKSELEERVCLLEEEIASLQNYTHRAQIIPENEINDPTFSCSCNNESSVLNCGNCSSTTINTKISGKTIEEEDIENEENQGPVTPIKSVNCVAASTPMRNEPILVKIPSLCAEMRDMLRSNGESLPTPFCGKHILPAALYRDRSIHGLDETDSPKMKIPKLEKNSRLAIEGSFDISSDSRPDFNLPRCTCGSLVQNVIFQENFLPMAKLEETPDFLNILQKNLQELASTLLTINADTTTTTPNAPQSVAETNGIINEPPPSSNTQGGVDESLKDQINCELKVLRSQIAKTQAILSYLSRGQKLPAGIASLNSFIIEKDSKHRAKSDFSGSFNRLSGDLLAASESGHKKGLWVREHVRNPSYSPSQKSTPLHRSRWLTKSCPNLPSHWSVINRSTQTENSQMASETTFPRTPTSDLVPKTPTTPPRISPNEKPGSDEVDSPPTNREDILSITVSPLALRNRSLSYVTAIKKGNWDDASSNLLTVGQDVVIVHDKTPDFKSPPSEDDNKNHKDVVSSYDDDLNGYLNENRNTAKSDPELECEPQIELSSNLSEKAKKRRRSFSEHNSSYSGTIDLEEHEADLSRPEQMQGPFVTANSNGSPPLPMDKVTTAMPVSLSPPSQDVSLVKFPKASAAFTARVALSDKPKRLGRNPRFLMPDVMETSETESAKDSANGSMESETTEPITTTTTVLTTATTAVTITTVASAITTCSTVEVIKPPPPGLEPSFPSLPDDFLKKLNLEKGSLLNTEEMTSQEVESKFGTLSLAFKTDKFTLSKRLEIQKRQRDMAEGNIDKEVGAMREALNALNHMCTDSQMRDLIIKLQHQIDIVHQSTSRMSSRAEVYGAVQQEFRARLYSAVTPSISPAKLERLTAVAVTSGAASCSTPSPPITPSSNNTANQRFPFPIAAPSTTGSGHLRKLAIGSSATGPLNSLTGNEELLAALDRVETVENAKTDSQKSESEEKSKESNNNEVYNEEPKEVELQVEHQRLVSNTKSSNKEETRDASANDASQQTTRSAFNPYPYYRQLSRILFRNDPIRPNHWLSNWLPDDGWWSHWNFNTVSRNVRFSVSFILIVGALLSIIVTFFPTQTTACGSSATYVSRSVQEFLADILRPYVTFRNNNPPV